MDILGIVGGFILSLPYFIGAIVPTRESGAYPDRNNNMGYHCGINCHRNGPLDNAWPPKNRLLYRSNSRRIRIHVLG